MTMADDRTEARTDVFHRPYFTQAASGKGKFQP